MDTPTASELIEATGISPSYASMILNGKRSPSLALSILIFRKTAWRHPRIRGLSDEQIASLELLAVGAAA